MIFKSHVCLGYDRSYATEQKLCFEVGPGQGQLCNGAGIAAPLLGLHTGITDCSLQMSAQ